MNARGRRAKGAAGEREACALLTERLGQSVRRRLGQSREGGHDTQVEIGDRRVYVEIKRQERASLHAWLEQAEEACEGDEGCIPAVMWRPSRRGWVVCMDLDDWCWLAREAMK